MSALIQMNLYWKFSRLDKHKQGAFELLKLASFSFIFAFSNKHYNFYKYMLKNVRPVCSAGIRTLYLQNMCLLPLPWEQGCRGQFGQLFAQSLQTLEDLGPNL